MSVIHSTRRRAAALVAASSLALVALAGCSSGGTSGTASGAASGSASGCVARILLVANVTGAGAQNGTGLKAGATAAIDEVNAAGGINGCTAALDVKDDESDYTKVLPLLQGAVSDYPDYVNIAVDDYGAIPAAPYLARQGLMNINDGGIPGADDPKTNPYSFSVVPVPADTDTILIDQIIADGHKKLAILTDNTTIGSDNISILTKRFEAAGGQVVDAEQLPLDTINMTPAVQKLQASGADAVYVSEYGAQAGYFVRDMRASGWGVPIYGGQYVNASDLASLVPPKDVEGIKLAGTTVTTTPSSAGVEALIKAVTANGGSVRSNLQSVAAAHDMVLLTAWSANGAKSTKPADMSKYLEDHGTDEVPGLLFSKNTNFSATNHYWRGTDGLSIIQAGVWDENGRLPRIKTFTYSE